MLFLRDEEGGSACFTGTSPVAICFYSASNYCYFSFYF